MEPTGVMQLDGKRPDGRCQLVWDATCPDTQAASYRTHATSMLRKLAEAAEERKIKKYWGLPPGHIFVPVATESLRGIDPRSVVPKE